MTLVEALYGEPERTMPALCVGLGLATGLLTHSWRTGVAASLAALLAWDQAARRLVITDQRLGPVRLHCPNRNNAGRPQVWLTFDDGPGPETIQLLELLNEAEMPATFFFIGEQVESFPERALLAELLQVGGHSVANHSWSHPNLLRLAEPQVREELNRTQRLLESHFPGLVRPWFRPPFGYRGRGVMRQLGGLELIGWSLNSLDFLKGDPARIPERVESLLKPGQILLFHDGRQGRQRTVEALEGVLSVLHRRGFAGYREGE